LGEVIGAPRTGDGGELTYCLFVLAAAGAVIGEQKRFISGEAMKI
jgi:hypothetical protein